MALNASDSAQLDACTKQVADLQTQLDKQKTLSELYRNEILTDSEFLGFTIEIFDKIQASINSGVINTMPVEEQRQLQETLVYVKERQAADNLYRKEGDPEPRTYEEYRNP
ncbi:hypothetical protein PANPA_00201 (plasmid) [Pantoea sp. Nvir]|uniref:hypothetical protein n=1 Tax=unclassified Pantoea TaxID=2630326 RepID=UPI001EF613E5|nr:MULTISPECIES: hypothetical protein [unclassified Pantoea]MCG7368778.1 hypothetical protein [Pantoea sp. ACRSH]MCG7399158.1 hypothetical protein [Pantoea sp. ACRSC]